jgi:hypothetical protein
MDKQEHSFSAHVWYSPSNKHYPCMYKLDNGFITYATIVTSTPHKPDTGFKDLIYIGKGTFHSSCNHLQQLIGDEISLNISLPSINPTTNIYSLLGIQHTKHSYSPYIPTHHKTTKHFKPTHLFHKSYLR